MATTNSTTKRKSYHNISKDVKMLSTAAFLATAGIVVGASRPDAAVPQNNGESTKSIIKDYSSVLLGLVDTPADFSLIGTSSDLVLSSRTRTSVYVSQEQQKKESISQLTEVVSSEAQRTSDHLDYSAEVADMVDSILDEVTASAQSLDTIINENNRAIEEEERRQAAKYSSRFGSISVDEYNNLLRIVEAEAGNQGMTGKILVANVIFNRMESGRFPNSLNGVVFQNNQFSPISDGRFYSISVSASTVEAVDRALAGEDYSSGALYFTAFYDPSSWFGTSLTLLFQEGDHYFYK